MRLRLFGGKGGAGKTTLAAAAAVGAAEGAGAEGTSGGESGDGVLVVSTDPAHSLGDALGVRLKPEPVRVETRRGSLWAMEMEAGRALAGWLAPRRAALVTLGERGTFLDREDVSGLLDLGMPGVDELAGLLEALRTARRLGCGEVVLDTAPTAHTLRLLGMPATLRGSAALLLHLAEKPRVVAESFGGAWTPDEADEAAEGIAVQARGIEELLRDPERTSFTWVTLPEAMSVAETRDGLAALAELGIPVGEIAVNRLTPPAVAAGCGICAARREAELAEVERVRQEHPELPLRLLPAAAREPRGLPALRRFARALASPSRGRELLRPATRDRTVAAGRAPAGSETQPGGATVAAGGASPNEVSLDAADSPPLWLPVLAPPHLELLLVGGKGGVGKTTCAAAVALTAARDRPGRVLLLSADPAHSLGDALGAELGDEEGAVPGAPPNLRCREIDPERALARWRSRYGDAAEDLLETLTGLPPMETDTAKADLLGLTPPGLDELAVLDALIDLVPAPDSAVHGEPLPEGTGDRREQAMELASGAAGAAPAQGADRALVVVDTAPTGHALRLLAMPETALAWDHALMALLLKYREAVAPGALAAELVTLSRGLKRLSALLHDPLRARFAVVTRAAELPRRETMRLLDALAETGIAPAAVVVNALPAPSSCPRCSSEAAAAVRQTERLRQELARRGAERAIIFAPAAVPPPRGMEALASWSTTWRLERP